MDIQLDKFNDFNYLEINMLNSKNNRNNENNENNENIININWEENDFINILNVFLNKYRLKPFEKRFKIIKHKDLNLEYNISENKYYVNKILYINHLINQNYILFKYNKQNLPQISFPSTKNINDQYYLNKIIFKITNRIYINFEIKKKINNKNKNEEIYRRIYINFNNDKNNVDNNNINELLNKCINYF
tara:strand:+ start:173 stop:742 length:570 start_codon:yes stop_codon:yes gene_type:complete